MAKMTNDEEEWLNDRDRSKGSASSQKPFMASGNPASATSILSLRGVEYSLFFPVWGTPVSSFRIAICEKMPLMDI